MSSKKIDTKKLLLWVAICSLIMMFAGFTSAYLVKKNQLNWLIIPLPLIFYISTTVIVVSSYFMNAAVKQTTLKSKQFYLLITFILGISFIVLQLIGFKDLEQMGVALIGNNSNAAASFLVVINSVHILHVVGGLCALGYGLYITSRNNKPFEVIENSLKLIAIFWHFLCILWLYLFVFYKWIA